jgi:hypothetical protein
MEPMGARKLSELLASMLEVCPKCPEGPDLLCPPVTGAPTGRVEIMLGKDDQLSS